MIDPITQIPVTLTAQQWNTVLLQLAEGPYRVVASLLQAIQIQCQRYESTDEPDNITRFPAAE